jgi:hypothetical protein
MDYLEFIARVTSHIPDKGQVMVRYYGRIEEIEIGSYPGKRLRGELLVYLKENGGLTYREIAEISLFSDVQMASLGKMYRDARLRIKSRSKEVKHRGA